MEETTPREQVLKKIRNALIVKLKTPIRRWIWRRLFITVSPIRLTSPLLNSL